MSKSKIQNSGSRTLKGLPRRDFVIDKITEDSFCENLLLGLVNVLKSCRFVSHIRLDRLPPATLDEVLSWEYSNHIRLPEDLRNFYLSTNGFSFSYRFQYDREEPEEPCHVTAAITVNPLFKLENALTEDSRCMTESGAMIAVPQSNVFILTEMEDDNCVVMTSFGSSQQPTFWLYYKRKNLFYLCADFVTYFRMALAHLGIPGWQLAVLKANLPECSAELLQILAPGVLHNRQAFDVQTESNVIDARIFNDEFCRIDEVAEVKQRSTKSRTTKKK